MEVYNVPVWARVFESLHDEQMNHFWRPPLKEKFLRDISDWKSVPSGVKRKIKTVLRLLTLMEVEVIDGISCINHGLPRIIGIMLGMQEAMEGIHTRSYSVIDSILEYDGPLLDDMIEKRMSILMWNKSDMSLAEKLVHLSCSEGIAFNSLFCLFFLLEMKGLLPMTCTINKEVLSDEYLHTRSSAVLYNSLIDEGIIERLDKDKVYDIVNRYVLIDDIASESLYGDDDPFFLNMSGSNSKIYTRIIANSVLLSLGYDRIYSTSDNPYKFIDQSLVNTLEFFFDKDVVAYGLDAENKYDVESEDEECYV